MPEIDLIQPVNYRPQDPYQFEFDNLPLDNILRRQDIINNAVDKNSNVLRESQGTQGTLDNRLNVSINADGTLKTEAIDVALHSIESHEDSETYVRMLADQSSKLDLIADEATDVSISVSDGSSTAVDFTSGAVEFIPSDTITWIVEAPNKVKPLLTFPTSAIHQHFYDQTPIDADNLDPDNINFIINTLLSPSYIDGTLRVYVNGTRLSETAEVLVPGAEVGDSATPMSFTGDSANGTFALSTAAADDDVIRIDYNLSF